MFPGLNTGERFPDFLTGISPGRTCGGPEPEELVNPFPCRALCRKGSIRKAIGIGLRGITLKNILVVNNHNGKPAMRLFGNALDAFKRSGGETIHLSLTHERDNALAMVVIEGDPVD